MRHGVTAAASALALVAGAACGGGGEKQQAAASGVFFGAVGFTTDRVGVAIDPPSKGKQHVRVFITDGQPNGDAEWFEATASKNRLAARSVSGKATLDATLESAQVHGTVTLPDGKQRHFHTIPATHGAGIYDVTVTADGHYTGTSTDGSKLDGRQNGTFVEGVLTTAGGEKINYRVVDTSRAFNVATKGGAADRYTVIVSRYGLVQMGRGGGDAVKTGAPSPNLISLDLGASQIPSPGLYYGKVATTTDQFAMQLDGADAAGNRKVRVYLSDGEPEPEGDIEWFTGTVGKDNKLDLTSASKKARFQGVVGEESASGTVTLPDQPARPFFAVPAGDGAGIYEVTVDAGKNYRGTSEDGTVLELSQKNEVVQGSFTLKDGRKIALLAYDLTKVYAYSVEGSQPGSFLAFASPGGRFLIGRSGDVRGGSAGLNIIGLDKAC